MSYHSRSLAMALGTLCWRVSSFASAAFVPPSRPPWPSDTIVNNIRHHRENERHHHHRPSSKPHRHQLSVSTTTSWADIEGQLEPAWSTEEPVSIDSALGGPKPTFSSERPTLFRERHGWCPYSERVWLALEVIGNGDVVPYDTVRIDNTGHGPRPSYFSGQTPQLLWPEATRPQGESMDLVYELDRRYNDNKLQSNDPAVRNVVSEFRNIFPRARPSSRAAYLFQYNGDPLWRSTFEETLRQTDDLLGETAAAGPFFCGNDLTAADIGWAPFLERYRYQLPCLHQGLLPDDPAVYPHLAAWYEAMDRTVAPYACRVKGDASSWRKVLTMAGFGNSFVPPEVDATMQDRIPVEEAEACQQETSQQALWQDYASTRPFVASSPAAQAALIITRNRQAIVRDVVARSDGVAGSTDDEATAEKLLLILVQLVLSLDETSAGSVVDDFILEQQDDSDTSCVAVAALATSLDERMCVPRDMGALSARCIKQLAVELRRAQAQ